MGTVLQVFFKPHARLSDNYTYQFVETDLEDLQAAFEVIAEDELIVGKILYSHPGEAKGERIIHREEVVGFRGGAVDRVALPHWKFFRVEA
ncbi:hypothetical protein [Roseobacter sp. S98]|uniref:hypothetical protein n=1 Tax=Roseobacter algicola (ex Choi et al. 2025) (nom. illeg.) TaxID=3092138 RepID=UPI0035C74A49